MTAPIFDKILIDGHWVPAANGHYPVMNPATESVAGYAPRCSTEQVVEAVMAARRAFDQGPWPRISRAERSALLHKAASRFATEMKDLVDLTIDETGAVPSVVEQLHLGMSATRLEFHANVAGMPLDLPVPALDVNAGAVGSARSEGVVVRDPIGVVAVIAPYNAPILVAMGKIAPAAFPAPAPSAAPGIRLRYPPLRPRRTSGIPGFP